MREFHELTEKALTTYECRKGERWRNVDEVIREWLECKSNLLANDSRHTKEYFEAHLGLTPNPVNELAERLREFGNEKIGSFKDYTLDKYICTRLAEEAIRWHEEQDK